MKRVAADAHLPAPWLFEPAKRPDGGADYCFDIVQRFPEFLVLLHILDIFCKV